MDENIYENEQSVVEENTKDLKTDELKSLIEEQMEQMRTQSMLLGAQVFCRVILDKINAAMRKPGKRSMNDYKRLVKEIEDFCETGISRKVNPDGTTTPVEVTVQN
jgi:hypothetical protein